MNYKNKYLKYKSKYLSLKNNQSGGVKCNKDCSKILLFSSPEMNDVISEILAIPEYSKYIERGIITKSTGDGPSKCEEQKNTYNTFADGWPDLFICDHNKIKNHNVVYLASITKPDDLF